MSIEFLWRLPMHGDGRKAHDKHTRGEWNTSSARVAPRTDDDDFGYIDYLSQVARAAEINGFHGALIPIFRFTDEPWVTAAALARETRRLRLLIALQPHFIQPAYAAQMAASLQRVSRGRVEWNVISGGDPNAQKGYGDFNGHDERYARTEEFLDVVRGVTAGAPFDYEGRHYQVQGGGLLEPLVRQQVPRVYLAGASDASMRVAARHADVHLTWGEPLAKQREVVDAARRAFDALKVDREIRFGMRIDVLARETEEQAWAELRQMYATVDDATRNFGFGGGARTRGASESVGAQRQRNLTGGSSAATYGPACPRSAAVRAACSSAATSRWPSASRNTSISACRALSWPAIRTWRKPTAWARKCCRWCRRRPAARRILRLCARPEERPWTPSGTPAVPCRRRSASPCRRAGSRASSRPTASR